MASATEAEDDWGLVEALLGHALLTASERLALAAMSRRLDAGEGLTGIQQAQLETVARRFGAPAMAPSAPQRVVLVERPRRGPRRPRPASAWDPEGTPKRFEPGPS